MNYLEIIGFMARGLVAISFFPQVMKSWKTKSTKDIAISLTVINIIGQILWITYATFISSFSLMIMSGITLIMVASLLILKLKYG